MLTMINSQFFFKHFLTNFRFISKIKLVTGNDLEDKVVTGMIYIAF